MPPPPMPEALIHAAIVAEQAFRSQRQTVRVGGSPREDPERGLGVLEDATGKLEKLQPCDGRASPSVCALEQNGAELIFEIAQPSAQSRLVNGFVVITANLKSRS